MTAVRPALLAAATAAALALSSPAPALQEFEPGKLDKTAGTFTYQQGQVYKLDCTMLSTVTIVLDPEEDAEKGGTLNGDPAAYEWESGGNMLVLRCKSEVRAQLGRSTILSAHTVHRKTGERRAYPFRVTTRPLAKDAADGISLVTFRYPDQEARERREAAEARAEQERSERGPARLAVAHYQGRRNREYWWQAEPGSPGAALAQGLRVSDNGMLTTFEFRGNHAGGSILHINESGQEMTMTQAPRDGGAVVLSRVIKSADVDKATKERWVLRLGDAALCIWNLDPGQPVGGYNPGTGTADPGVIIRPRRRPRAAPTAQAAEAGPAP